MLGRLPPFEYHRPSTLEEALNIIRKLDGNCCLLAGGTDLLVAMKEKRGSHPPLIDLKQIPGIGDIRAQNGDLHLGGGARARAIAQSSLVQTRTPVLAQAVGVVGSMQIGNRATIGGNLANASPAADCAPPLLVLGGSVKLVGMAGERWVSLEDFFVGPKKTVIDREVLTEIRVPTLPEGGKGVFCKLGLRAAPEDIAIVSVAIFALPDISNKNWKQVRIALGAVAPTPIRAHHAEESLTGQPIAAKVVADASRLAAEKDAQPISDIRGSASYRRAMVQVLVQRMLSEMADSTTGELRA